MRKKGAGIQAGKAPIITLTLFILVTYYVVFLLYPIGRVIYGSFFNWNPLIGSMIYIGLDNYIAAMNNSLFWESIRNTLVFTISATLIRTPLGLFLAIILFNIKRFRTFFRLAYFMPFITSTIAVAVVWSLMYDPRIGVFNMILQFFGLPGQMWLRSEALALPSVIAMAIWKHTGFVVILYLSGLASIPRECIEAAQIDGASKWNVFRLITIPLLKPTTLVVVVMSIITYMKVFTEIFVMTGGGPVNATTTMVYHIYVESFVYFRFGYASAVSVLLLVLVLVVALAQFKIIRTDWSY